MFRGTTPTLRFRIPFDTSAINVMYITIAQNGEIVLDKEKDDCVLEGETITLRLTQADTLRLTEEYPVEIQMRCRLHDGNALASRTIRTTASAILKDGEI